MKKYILTEINISEFDDENIVTGASSALNNLVGKEASYVEEESYQSILSLK